MLYSPSAVAPRYKKQIAKSTSKQGDRKQQHWRSWETLDLALKECSPIQRECWLSFPRFRLEVANHFTYPHMQLWINELFTGEDSRSLRGIAGKDTLILAPRESSKSTVLAQFVAFEIGIHTSPWVQLAFKVLGISYNQETALPRSKQIQNIIASKRYRQIFPWVRPSKDVWGAKEWKIDLAWAGLPTGEEQYTYVAGGILGGINSRRCHLVFLDDLIKSPDAIKSESVRTTMISTFESVVKFCPFDGARMVCLGTRMTELDIYCTTFIEPKGWRVIEQSALLTKEDGTEYSYWEPDSPTSPGTPLIRLQKERAEMPITFSFQRQNKIIRVKEQSVDPLLIRRSPIPDKFDALVLGVDLSAGTKERNDYTAMVLGGRIASEEKIEYWIIDAWEDRIMGNMEKLEAIIDIWDSWNHLLPTIMVRNPIGGKWEEKPIDGLNLWFDSSAYGLSLQGDYQQFIVQEKKIDNWKLTPVPASGRGDKLHRLRKHTGVFSNKIITFNQFSRIMPDGRQPMGRLIQQITEFGSVPNDDLADAFELCVSGLRSYTPLSRGEY